MISLLIFALFLVAFVLFILSLCAASANGERMWEVPPQYVPQRQEGDR